MTLSPDPTTGFLASTALGSVADSYGYDQNGAESDYVATYNGASVYERGATMGTVLTI